MAHAERVREAGRKLTVVAHSLQAVQESHVDAHAEAQEQESQVDGVFPAEDCHGSSVAHLHERPKNSGYS
jgi:hypothetical protein